MSEDAPKRRARRPGRGPRAAMSGGAAGAAGARPASSAGTAAETPEAPSKPRKTSKSDPPAPQPRAKGFLHAAALAARPMREASAKRGFAETRVLTDWPTIAGEALARVCTPVRVSYSGKGFGATLILQVEGARAPEAEMMGPRLVERVNAHYGYRAVSRVKVIQTGRTAPAPGLAEAAEPFARPAPEAPGTPETAPVASGEVVSGVSDPGLRAALERLGRRVSSRGRA